MEQLDSKDELYFSWWCDDLIKAEILYQYEKSQNIKLFNGVYNEYTQIKELKTKTKEIEKEQCLIEVHSYTPDYDLYFRDEHEYVTKFISWLNTGLKIETPFICTTGKDVISIVIVEIKPIFDQSNMTRLFKVNQKWVYEKTGLFVNLIEYSKLFRDTFTPSLFLLTDSGKQQRMINKWEVRTLEEFLNM